MQAVEFLDIENLTDESNFGSFYDFPWQFWIWEPLASVNSL
jgi:hypothetical protein